MKRCIDRRAGGCGPGLPRQLGFTLLEIMVVLAIATLLVLFAAPNIAALYRSMTLSAEGRRLYGAFVEAQGLATATGRPHKLKLDRVNRTWEIWSDISNDGTFAGFVKKHPQNTDGWPEHIAFGPVAGVAAAFPAPFGDVNHDAWCTPCGADEDDGEIRFDVDGRILDDSDEILSGSILLHDTTAGSGGRVQALVFVGATGSLRLFNATE
ncbi:MAG: prepilin-type N-terminal cleavage/methylation domain-containing protein [Deltaproteobacteria bacterium]|nr:prepilin-type N-terminal cleavage/methylation domain-containing protein [Deltaproteobacteria bacterium]